MIDPGSLALDHPLSFLVVLALSLVDGVFPLVPARTMVIGLGVLAGSGDQRAYPLVAVATAGAFLSDNASYWIGDHWGPWVRRLLVRGRRTQRVWRWVEGEIRDRGPALVALARVIPGGPTPITMTAGLVRLPLRSFRVAAALSAVLWSAYAFSMGLFGDAVVGRHPLLAFAVALLVAGAVNLVLTAILRRRRARDAGTTDGAGREDAVEAA